jgi:hypothetical protein
VSRTAFSTPSAYLLRNKSMAQRRIRGRCDQNKRRRVAELSTTRNEGSTRNVDLSRPTCRKRCNVPLQHASILDGPRIFGCSFMLSHRHDVRFENNKKEKTAFKTAQSFLFSSVPVRRIFGYTIPHCTTVAGENPKNLPQPEIRCSICQNPGATIEHLPIGFH